MDINKLSVEFGHTSAAITQAVGKLWVLNWPVHLTCKDSASEKAKKAGVSELAVERWKVKRERFFIDTSCLFTVFIGSK